MFTLHKLWYNIIKEKRGLTPLFGAIRTLSVGALSFCTDKLIHDNPIDYHGGYST